MLLQDQHRCTSQVTNNKIQNNLLVKLLYLGLRLYRQLVGSENPTRIPPTTQYKPTHPPQPFRDSADDKAEGDDKERVEITTRVTDVKKPRKAAAGDSRGIPPLTFCHRFDPELHHRWYNCARKTYLVTSIMLPSSYDLAQDSVHKYQ